MDWSQFMYRPCATLVNQFYDLNRSVKGNTFHPFFNELSMFDIGLRWIYKHHTIKVTK